MFKFFRRTAWDARHFGLSVAETRARSEAFQCYPGGPKKPMDSRFHGNDEKNLNIEYKGGGFVRLGRMSGVNIQAGLQIRHLFHHSHPMSENTCLSLFCYLRYSISGLIYLN
jgi:hypothetical protein